VFRMHRLPEFISDDVARVRVGQASRTATRPRWWPRCAIRWASGCRACGTATGSLTFTGWPKSWAWTDPVARFIATKAVLIAFASYASPGRALKIGDVVELSAAEVTAIGAGNLRSVTARDALGEAVGVSNSD
jgi:hypothetical protein